MPPKVAERIVDKRYKLVRQLGRGGMGVVYEAVNLRNDRAVALKLLATNIGEEMPDVTARFEREVRATSSIDSDNIVRVYDAGTDTETGAPYMVMELVKGLDLHQWFRRIGQMQPEAVIRIAAQVAQALSKAHAAGVIHRDIKPGNVFIAEQGEELVAKVLDFGIAKLKMEQVQGDVGLTKTGNMLGSPHYMSPEQAQGLKSIDHRTDIWSLGVLMYKALTGRTPYADLESMGQVIIAIFSLPVPPVQDLAPWVDAKLAAVVHKALEKKPDQRYQTADEFLSALRALSSDPGLRLDATLLAPLGDDVRSVVATRLDRVEQYEAPTLGEGATAKTVELTIGAQAAEPRSGGGKFIWLGVAATLAIGAGVSLGVSESSKRQQLAQREAELAAARQELLAAPTVTAEPPAPVVAEPVAQVVKFGVPGEATVTVDGEAAEVSEGAIALSGLPGSVKTVVVKLGRREVTQTVAITEQGAQPPALPADALRERRSPAGNTSKKPGDAAEKTPPPAKTNTAIERKFELPRAPAPRSWPAHLRASMRERLALCAVRACAAQGPRSQGQKACSTACDADRAASGSSLGDGSGAGQRSGAREPEGRSAHAL